MIKRLRKNIILVNMALVGVVILSIFAVVCFNSYQTAYNNLEHGMTEMLHKNFMRGDEMPLQEKFGKRDFKGEMPMQLSAYVIVEVDEGEIKNKQSSNLTIDDEILEKSVKYVTAHEERTGQLNDYGLMYTRDDYGENTKIIFTDNSSVYNAFFNTLIISALLFLGSMIIIFLISLWLSGIAVKPVKKAWEQQKQFVADASHELKTPLTVILANNNIMMTHKNNTVAQETQWLESTEEEAQHMKQLIDQMLFLAKSDAGNNNIQFSDVDFGEIVEGTALNFEPVAFEREILINTDIAPGVEIYGNSLQLKQLAHILIDNAVKYSADKNDVTINLKKTGEQVVFSVNNFGNEMSPEELEHIFDRFYRAEKSRTTKGYGLGLSIAQNIVESMNGKLTVESNKESGTTFTAVFKTPRQPK
ncbi:MAG TPA: two-component sensor histidine kinase [Ruminococcaceae bacterium]|nr:two-component sensor histidine kinase [Oscillospiraceae bacterium]